MIELFYLGVSKKKLLFRFHEMFYVPVIFTITIFLFVLIGLIAYYIPVTPP